MTAISQDYQPDLSHELKRVEPYDFGLLMAILMLLGLGAVLVYSATITEDALGGDGEATLRTHLVHISLGITTMIAGMLFPYRRWKKLVYPILAGVMFLLVMVIFFGTEAGHARRWLRVPGFSIQPAEMAKLAFVIFLAYSLAKKADRIKQFSVAFIPHLLVCSAFIFLCLFQPDFGTCVILVLIMFAMLFVAGTRMAYISLAGCVGLFMGLQAIAMNNMRLGRVMAFIDPWAHRTDRGYQMVNSLIAFGSGGITGQSLGFGGQTITGFLPEGHTDFILSVMGEQLGLIGVTSIIVLFGFVLFRGIRIATSARDEFGRFLAFGITLLIVMQAVINMMVATALIPTKGLTLPFVSYGGSSMLTCCLGIGILLSISRDISIGQMTDFAPVAPRDPEKSPKKRRSRRRKKTPRQLPLEEVLR
ncbi:MAG: putative lipid II flippase FtsW [Myxococcota bacterium]